MAAGWRVPPGLWGSDRVLNGEPLVMDVATPPREVAVLAMAPCAGRLPRPYRIGARMVAMRSPHETLLMIEIHRCCYTSLSPATCRREARSPDDFPSLVVRGWDVLEA